MIPIRRIYERSFFVDDPNSGLLSMNRDFLNGIKPIDNIRMQLHGRFGCGLCMKLGGKRHLEQDVFHHVAAERSADDHRLVLEHDIVKAPTRCRQRRGVSLFAGHGPQRQLNRSLSRVASSPAFARTGIRCMSIRAECTTVQPSHANRIGDLRCIATEDRACDGR